MPDRSRNLGPTFWFSIVIILIGLFLLLENLNIYYFDDIWEYWPGLLILIGIYKLYTSRFTEIYSNLFLIAIGSVLLLWTTGYLYWYEIWQFWPIILIAIGARIIYTKLKHDKDGQSRGTITDDRIDHVAIFGGKEKRVASQNFQGGNIVAVFGGIELFFDNSHLSEGENILDVLVVFGGAEIYVPSNWKIITKGFPVFGGFEDKRRHISNQDTSQKKELVIKGLVLFGGLEIKDAVQTQDKKS
jgi:predicted membrane protein